MNNNLRAQLTKIIYFKLKGKIDLNILNINPQ